MKYYLAAISSFTIWGTFALALKPLAAFTSIEILVHRILFAIIGLGILCIGFRRKALRDTIAYIRALSKRKQWLLGLNVIISAIMLALNWFSFIYVMNHVSVNATSLAYLICPILTTVLAYFFLKDRLTKLQWIAVGLSALSCALLAKGHFIDMLYSLSIALTYAIYLILQKFTIQLDKFIVLSVQLIIGAVILLPIIGDVDVASIRPSNFYYFVSIVAIIYTIIPMLLNMVALKGLNSSIVGSLIYLNPILSFGLAVFYYKEAMEPLQFFAFGLIAFAVILFNVSYMHAVRKAKLQLPQ